MAEQGEAGTYPEGREDSVVPLQWGALLLFSATSAVELCSLELLLQFGNLANRAGARSR